MRALADKSNLKRKNLILDQRKIDRAKEILGAATETEAIHRALDEALELARFREETEAGLHDLLGLGGFADHFAPSTSTSPDSIIPTSARLFEPSTRRTCLN